jgi:hypothetical protein
VAITLNGNTYKSELFLNTSGSSIFTPTFQYLVAKEDAHGRVYLVDDTPSAAAMQKIEQNFFVDHHTGSAVSVKNHQGQVTVHGVTNNHALIPSSGSVHQIRELKTDPPTSAFKDYVELHDDHELSFMSGPALSPRATVSSEPEVWVIFDYKNTEGFNQDRAKILDYLGVFFHAINNRYATVPDPSIRFRISGVTTVASRAAQPYLESSKVWDAYDSSKALSAVGQWVSANKASGPKFDLAALITGEDIFGVINGKMEKGVAGLAYLGMACVETPGKYVGTSITEDMGGVYEGLISVTHELAHNLGAPHDGQDVKTQTCPWSEGYIMSYEGWGTKNKFTFSPCSINLMKNYISSTQGTCLRGIQSTTDIPISNDNIGDRITMTEQCVKKTGHANAVPSSDKTPDELCKMLYCSWEESDGWQTMIYTTGYSLIPGDNVACGTGGKCVEGECVVG